MHFSPSVVDTPMNPLSVGKRCQKDGMEFVWLGSRKMPPYFVCKDRSAGVEYNIPYFKRAGNSGVQPRGKHSKQVRLPLPPSRPGVYTAPSAAAAVGITITTHTNTATMTTYVRKNYAHRGNPCQRSPSGCCAGPCLWSFWHKTDLSSPGG